MTLYLFHPYFKEWYIAKCQSSWPYYTKIWDLLRATQKRKQYCFKFSNGFILKLLSTITVFRY